LLSERFEIPAGANGQERACGQYGRNAASPDCDRRDVCGLSHGYILPCQWTYNLNAIAPKDRQTFGEMIADLRRNAPLFWSTGGRLQEPDELPGVCKRLDLEHGLDQPILPPLRHRGAGELAEFLDDIFGWRKRVLAAARRLTRLG